MFVERKAHYSALFTNLVRWHDSSVSFPLSDIIFAQLACPLSDIMFCLHSELSISLQTLAWPRVLSILKNSQSTQKMWIQATIQPISQSGNYPCQAIRVMCPSFYIFGQLYQYNLGVFAHVKFFHASLTISRTWKGRSLTIQRALLITSRL